MTIESFSGYSLQIPHAPVIPATTDENMVGTVVRVNCISVTIKGVGNLPIRKFPNHQSLYVIATHWLKPLPSGLIAIA